MKMKSILAVALSFWIAASASVVSAAMQNLIQAPALSHGDVRAAINTNATNGNANFAEHESEINAVNTTKLDKGGIVRGDGVALVGSGTVASPYILPGKPMLVQPTAPLSTEVFWVDTGNGNSLKAYVSGAWVTVGAASSGGTSGVASVNTKTGVVVLETDDISDAASVARKFATPAEKTAWNAKQARVTGTCTGDNSIQSVNADGTVSCSTIDSISLSASAPLSINNTTGTVSISTSGATSGQAIVYNGTSVGWGTIAGGGGASNPDILSAIPYSDVACTNGGYYSGTLYLCISGFFTQKVATTTHTNASPAGTSDLFNRADGTLGAFWSDAGQAVSNLVISSNLVSTTSDWSAGAGRYVSVTSDISQVIAKGNAPAGTGHTEACVRMGAGTNGYCLRLTDKTGGNYTTVAVSKNGSWLCDADGFSYSDTADHTLRVVATGTNPVTITGFVDGTQRISSCSDSSSPIASGNPGIILSADGSPRPQADNWQGY